MSMHEMYWELQALLKRHGLVRVRRTAGSKEQESWVQPYEELKITIIAGQAPKSEVRSCLAKTMKVRSTLRREAPKTCPLCDIEYIGTPQMHKFDCPVQSDGAQGRR